MFDTIWSFVWEIVIVTVIFKMIVLRQLAQWLFDWFKRYAAKDDRRESIWAHYRSKALGQGHNTDSVLDCHETNCVAVFA